MRIRLLVPWRHFNKGHVIPEMPAAEAQMLVVRGFAEYVTEDMRSQIGAAGKTREYVTRVLKSGNPAA